MKRAGTDRHPLSKSNFFGGTHCGTGTDIPQGSYVFYTGLYLTLTAIGPL
jgi:hypothetical protein